MSARTLICGLLAGAAFACAQPAAATNLYLFSAAPVDAQAGSTDPVIDGRSAFGMSPLLADFATVGESNSEKTVLAFCIDFYTDTPVDADFNVDPAEAHYHTGELADAMFSDGTSRTLADDQVALDRIVSLINYGTLIWNHHNHTLNDQMKLASIQGAIWQIMTGKTFIFHPWFDPDPKWNVLIQDLAHGDRIPTRLRSDQIQAMFADGASQDMAYALHAAVPEPATWTLMIGGFVGAGVMLRTSRRRLRTAL